MIRRRWWWRVAISLVGCLALADAEGSVAAGMASGQAFRDGADFPEMIVVPAGAAMTTAKLLGDGSAGTTEPPREIRVPKAFAVGKYPVTVGQFAAFVKETDWKSVGDCYVWLDNGSAADQWSASSKASWRFPGFRQTPNDPVVCVNLRDANAYIRWLNAKLGKGWRATGPYRLPTKEEFEYFARGGAKTRYSWGDSISRSQANYGRSDCFPCGGARAGADRWKYTSPVGSFPSNGFGLYDTSGNVWQRTIGDIWGWPGCAEPIDPDVCVDTRANYHGYGGNGAAYGGGWNSDPRYIEIGQQMFLQAMNRNVATGFRVVRDLDDKHAD
jgi:formylglycine-generating enzyme required for sulfatase activity